MDTRAIRTLGINYPFSLLASLVLDMSSSDSSSIDLPGAFSTTKSIRAKSASTTYVTGNDMNWDAAFETQQRRKAKAKEREKEAEQESVSSAGSNHGSGSGSMRRAHGLLTPHTSLGNILSEQQGRRSKSSASPSNDVISETQDQSVVANPEATSELNLSSTPRPHVPVSTTTSTDFGSYVFPSTSYVSIGVQTSFPASPRASAQPRSPPPSPPASPMVPPETATSTSAPKKSRKRKPAYIRAGEREARAFASDLAYLTEKKRRLTRELARVTYTEKEYLSLLIPGPAGVFEDVEGENEATHMNTDKEDQGVETEAETGDSETVDLGRRVRSRRGGGGPLTPESSEHEFQSESQKSHMSMEMGSTGMPSRSTHSACSGSSTATFASALSHSVLSDSSLSVGTDGTSALAGPSYTGTGLKARESGARKLGGYAFADIRNLAPPPVRDPATYFIWFDLEKTNDAVRPAANIRILEVAVCVTDKNFTRLDDGISYLVHWPLNVDEVKQEMSANVREMHKKSGLLAAYGATPPDKRRTLAQVDRRVCRYLSKHDIEPNGRGVMAGAGVAFDRGMVRQHMERLDAYLGHQIFDTTTLWHLIRRKYNRGQRFDGSCAHRALDDIMSSIKEAKTYADTVMKAPKDVRWPSSRGI
ncbi:hypothetical protein DFH11DRAFT_1570788 [Phellopilus nigrolimitatus]|nr:hypothetical protein DFH11DRAFT_1570788 [Phellopilus nigrolimitatus]